MTKTRKFGLSLDRHYLLVTTVSEGNQSGMSFARLAISTNGTAAAF